MHASGHRSRSKEGGLEIVSWNVAGWRSALEKIEARHGGFDAWIEQLGADIVCLQEVKLSGDEIKFNPKKCGADGKHGYDSFWAFPNSASSSSSISSSSSSSSSKVVAPSQGKGLNGVATFVRKGLTLRATNSVFSNLPPQSNVTSSPSLNQFADLDREGRALMTDHGDFVVFNVYIPFSGSNYSRFDVKLRFQEALTAAISTQRSLGKRVVLAGDLNTSASIYDCHPSFCKINLDNLTSINFKDFGSCQGLCNRLANLLQAGGGKNQGQEKDDKSALFCRVVELVEMVKGSWPTIHQMLSTRTIEAVDSNNVSSPIYQFGQAPNASAVQQLNTCTAKTFRVTAYLDSTATSLNPAILNSNPSATQSRTGRKVTLGRSSNTRPITDYGVEEIQVDCLSQEMIIDGRDRLALKGESHSNSLTGNASNKAGNKFGSTNNSSSSNNSSISSNSGSSSVHLIHPRNALYMHEFMDIWGKLYGLKTEDHLSSAVPASSISSNSDGVNIRPSSDSVVMDEDGDAAAITHSLTTDIFSALQALYMRRPRPAPNTMTLAHLSLLVELFGRACHQERSVSWLNDLTSEHGLVDVVRTYFDELDDAGHTRNTSHVLSSEGRAEEIENKYSNSSFNSSSNGITNYRNGERCDYRFTCWDQQANSRMSNEGTRIDYILVDNLLIPTNETENGKNSNDDSSSSSSSMSSSSNSNSNSNCMDYDLNRLHLPFRTLDSICHHRALADAKKHAKGDSSSNDYLISRKASLVYTSPTVSGGLIYTPAEMSDHIAVYVRMARLPMASNTFVLSEDKETKAAQPHRQQTTILSMFGKAKSTSSSSSNSTSGGSDHNSNINSNSANSSINCNSSNSSSNGTSNSGSKSITSSTSICATAKSSAMQQSSIPSDTGKRKVDINPNFFKKVAR